MKRGTLAERWKAAGEAAPVSVEFCIDVSEDFLCIEFSVKETEETFCRQKEKDGEAVWQDSCVEVFLNMPNSGDYANFEFNSKGACFAATGSDRHNRTERTPAEYAQIIRTPSGITKNGKSITWSLAVKIPLLLIGANKSSPSLELIGNIYKCADKANMPHYFSLFPINTPKPDFHRPEFFSVLLYYSHA